MTVDYKSKRRQLDRAGFCLLEGILEAGLIARIRAVSDAVIARTDQAHFAEKRSQGSVIPVFDHPAFAELIASPAILSALAGLGFTEPKWGSGFVISKPPGSPPLFWHQDGRFWDHPISYTPRTIQCFLMIYLVDTSVHNGCLRLIPGSHLRRHALHDALPDAHETNLSRMTDPQHRAFQRAEGEVDVPVKAGDVVMGSARLLHAAHANQSQQRRTNITLWYYPEFARLPESIQARVVCEGMPDDWYAQTRALIEPLRPVYTGDVAPIACNREPGAEFR